MASYAELNPENRVLRVIKIDNNLILDENGEEDDDLGRQLCKQFTGSKNQFVKTSATAAIRKRFASVDSYYLPEYDEFTSPQPHSNWIYVRELDNWIPPISKPEVEEGYSATWSQSTNEWIISELPPPPNPNILSPEINQEEN